MEDLILDSGSGSGYGSGDGSGSDHPSHPGTGC